MLDLTSLLVLAGLFLGLVVGDAALFGDPVQVQISVPAKLAETGFNEAAAEQMFAAQVADMGRAVSIVQTPSVQVSTRPSILAALAKPLSLDNVVVAIQSQAGVDVVTVRGVILTDPASKRLDMMTVVSMPREVPVQIKISQADGDATALVHQSAEKAMEWVSPYRLALTQFARGLKADPAAMQRAKQIATIAVSRPWVPSRASEQVMLHNLLMIVALLEGADAEVHAQLDLIAAISGAATSAYGVVELNRSFLALAAGKATEAEQHYMAGRSMTAEVHLPTWIARVDTLGALVAWSHGNVARAEAMLRTAIADAPDDEAPHVYLARLLEAKGDTVAASAERATGAKVRRFDAEIPAQAQSLFWVDPVHGGLQPRDQPGG